MTRRRKPAPPCPQEHQHTGAPAGYPAWHEWAQQLARTHKQRRCPGCGLFKLWTRVYTPPADRQKART